MPAPQANPLLFTKLALWIVAAVGGGVLLARRRVTRRVRLIALLGGTLVFGFLYGLILGPAANPNPVASLRTLLRGLLAGGPLAPMIVVMVVVLLALVWVSNKSICGWACQLGLLQEAIYRLAPVRHRWKPPFWLSNGIRAVAFLALVGGLLLAGLDWIGLIDPFPLFSLRLGTWALLLVAGVLGASVFVFRPWCQFLCPFGLVGWIIEQRSLYRVRIDPDICVRCGRCAVACPTQAMADNLAGKAVRADCFACGDCLAACPKEGALGWRR